MTIRNQFTNRLRSIKGCTNHTRLTVTKATHSIVDVNPD